VGPGDGAIEQVNLRLRKKMLDRVDKIGEWYGLDRSHTIRMLLSEAMAVTVGKIKEMHRAITGDEWDVDAGGKGPARDAGGQESGDGQPAL
jgi:hypothetical protein